MSDGRFSLGRLVEFLKEKKSLLPIALALIVGIALMLWGSGEAVLPVSSMSVDESSLESRVKAMCERIDGASDAAVMITFTSDEQVRGIAVVCLGGDDPIVQLKLTKLLCSLFGITSDSVSIIGASRSYSPG